MKKRITALLLSVILCLSLVAGTALAAPASLSLSYSDGQLTLSVSGLSGGAGMIAVTDRGTPKSVVALADGGSQSALSGLVIATGSLANGDYDVKVYGMDGDVIATGSFNVTSGGGGGGGGTVTGGGSTTTESGSKPQVKKNDGGKVEISADGKSVTITADPGYWIKLVIANGKPVGPVGAYTFAQASSSNTVEVVFEKLTDNVFSSFTDAAGHWGKDAIAFVTARGLFNGTTPTTFAPNASMTRGMFVTVLARLAGGQASGAPSFTDVAADAWYAQGVAWCAQNGIVNGVGDNRFAPNASITREQLCVMLAGYVQYAGIPLPSAEQAAATDSDKVSSWATDAVTAMQRAGILQGRPTGEIDPQGTATRAEVATMLMRFIDLIQ